MRTTNNTHPEATRKHPEAIFRFRENGGNAWGYRPEAQKTVLPGEWRKSAPEAARKQPGSARKRPLVLRTSARARVRRGAAHRGNIL